MQAEQAVEILRPLVGEGTLVQTHASIVYITSDSVYKIKKPVNFGFLDYTQLKQRKSYSILEKELNSRFCDGVYLDVLKIIQNGKEAYSLVPLDNSLPTVEYVLKMKRISDRLFLSNQLDEISSETMEDIGIQIAKRLSVADKSPDKVDNMDIYEQVSFNCTENFQQLKEAAGDFMDNRFDFIKKTTEKFLIQNRELFYERYNNGFVKDGHGDLRVEHVFLEDEKVNLIDCIEFNNRFRTNDVVCEAAFLSMELDYFNKLDLSDAFLRGFFSVYKDGDSLKLLNFYRCYRAVVRAKIAVFTMLGYKAEEKEHREKLAEYHRMMDMAVIYARSCENLSPVVFRGMIASGKSVNSTVFAERFPVKRVNSDEARKKLAGMDINDNGVTDFNQGLYDKNTSLQTYSMLGRDAAEGIEAGRLSIIDATFMKKAYLDAFESALKAAYIDLSITPLYIEFSVPEDVIKNRLKAREDSASVSDGRIQHYEKMKLKADVDKSDIVLSGEADPHENTSKIMDFLIDKF